MLEICRLKLLGIFSICDFFEVYKGVNSLSSLQLILFCSGLTATGNKSATWLRLPPPGGGGEWKETGRKLVGRDKGSLTEQQTKGTATTMI